MLFVEDITDEQISRVESLIVALRSGKYVQGKGSLQDLNNNYCCLGVACQISGLGEFDDFRIFRSNDDSAYSVMPENVKNYYGFITNDGGIYEKSFLSTNGLHLLDKLTNMNDKGSTFREIADTIESEINLVKASKLS